MLEKLEIKNFMTFEELNIPTLKRVNLIAGKNNSGKTSLLDAIRILVSEGDNSVINNIVASRDSFVLGWNESYRMLFNRQKSGIVSNVLIINDFNIRSDREGNSQLLYYIGRNELVSSNNLNPSLTPNHPNDFATYVPFSSANEKLRDLWDKVALTEKEDLVYEVLHETIDTNILRIDVGKNIRVRLRNSKNPVALNTLGDGVYRMLLIALSLATSQNKILLIDEIELGLHYSALEKLWEMIFKYAEDWNIQVFVTTHSQDAIKSFHYVASSDTYISDAEYIRLQIGRNGENEAIIYDGERLRDSLDLQLEIR